MDARKLKKRINKQHKIVSDLFSQFREARENALLVRKEAEKEMKVLTGIVKDCSETVKNVDRIISPK